MMKIYHRSFLVLLVIVAGISVCSAAASKVNFCQGCRSLVSFMGNLNKTESRPQMKELFKDFCETYYPPSTDYQGPCSWFVNGIFLVMDRTDPVYHCDQIGACGVSINRHLISPTVKNNIQHLSVNANDGFCSVCQQLVNEAKAVLEDPGAIDMVHKQLDTLCDYLKVFGASGECKQEVDKYIHEAVEFIHELDPLQYCQSIQLCERPSLTLSLGNEQKQPKLPVLAEFNKFEIESSVQVDDQVSSESVSLARNLRGPGCTLCKTIVKELFHFLKENKTEENIRHGLEKICKLIYHDSDKISECDEMIDSYTRELIEFLAAESDPNLVCILIDQCTYQKSLDERTTNKPKLALIEQPSIQVKSLGQLMSRLDSTLTAGSFQTCLECKVFIRYLRDQIDKPLTEAKIKEFIMTKLCNNLGDKELQDSCKSLIHEYADIFFKAVVLELNPETACIVMEACQNKTQEPLEAIVGPLLIPQVFRPEPTFECEDCVQLVDMIDTFMSTYPGTPDSNTLIEALCPRMADELLCEKIINRAGPIFVHHVSDMKEPLGVCSEAKFCINQDIQT